MNEDFPPKSHAEGQPRRLRRGDPGDRRSFVVIVVGAGADALRGNLAVLPSFFSTAREFVRERHHVSPLLPTFSIR